MREIRKILQYRIELQVSADKTAAILQKSKGVIIETLKRFKNSGLSWPLPQTLTDSALEELLYPRNLNRQKEIPLPDIEYIKEELKHPHVTLQRLYEEYKQTHPAGMKRSCFYRFCNKHKEVEPTMRQQHKGGQTIYSDYSGDSLFYTDIETGNPVKTQLFVCSWGSSSCSYVEARPTQNKEDFTSVHVKSFNYFGVVPFTIVPDNLKSAVIKTDRYDPVINAHFGLMCDHYGITVLPARVRKPRDKAVVESNVLHVQKFILARLRHRQFFSLQELNEALWEELEQYNNRPMKDYGDLTRWQRFEAQDKPFAQPLPAKPFTVSLVKDNVKVARDYHVQIEKHFYSVPYILVGKRLQVRLSGCIIEMYYDNQRVATHQQSCRKHSFTTKEEHMPPAHRYVRGWSAGYFLSEATAIGPNTVQVIEKLLKRTDHVEHGYRSARGVLSLAKAYTAERLEKCCERVLVFKNISVTAIKSVLQQGIDKQPLLIRTHADPEQIIIHENIRGEKLFAQSEQHSTGVSQCI
jgi:transposase